MKKILIQGIALITIFLLTWKGLSQINWIEILFFKKISDKAEEKIGDFYLDIFINGDDEIKDDYIISSIDTLVSHICTSNKIERKPSIYIIKNNEINAFALPNRNIIIFTGLIEHSDNYQQLAGVISHEIAHIEQNHVMKKLIKEVGLSVILSASTGNGGNLAKESAKILSSTAFDRQMEKEADLKAVDYLISANINPNNFANFLDKLYGNEGELSNYFQWVNTHPSSDTRAQIIRDYSKKSESSENKILSQSTWDNIVLKIQ